MENKNFVVRTVVGYFAGQNEEGDDIFTSDLSQAKKVSVTTARSIATNRSHMRPRVLRVDSVVP